MTAGCSALICCALSTAQPISAASDAHLVGPTSPEGAARDLVRAYISKDAALFHQRRCKVSCEGKLDPAIAYTKFAGYKPRLLEGTLSGTLDTVGSNDIAKVLPVTPTPMSDEEATAKRIERLLSYGAFENKLIDVITVTPSRPTQRIPGRIHAPGGANGRGIFRTDFDGHLAGSRLDDRLSGRYDENGMEMPFMPAAPLLACTRFHAESMFPGIGAAPVGCPVPSMLRI